MQASQFSKGSNGDNGNDNSKLQAAGVNAPEHAKRAFEQLKPVLEALGPVPDQQRPRLAVLDAVEAAQKLAQVANEDRHLFEAHFKLFDMGFLDSLEARAMALWGAQHSWRMANSRDRQGLDAALESARDWRGKLLAALDYVFLDDDDNQRKLSEIRSGRGRRDLADDLAALHELASENLELVEAKTDLDAELIERVGIMSQKLLTLLNTVDEPEMARRKLLRDKAFAYLVEAYDEVVSHGRVIFRNDPKGAERYPSMYSYRPRGSSSSSSSESPAPVPSSTSTPTPPPVV